MYDVQHTAGLVQPMVLFFLVSSCYFSGLKTTTLFYCVVRLYCTPMLYYRIVLCCTIPYCTILLCIVHVFFYPQLKFYNHAKIFKSKSNTAQPCFWAKTSIPIVEGEIEIQSRVHSHPNKSHQIRNGKLQHRTDDRQRARHHQESSTKGECEGNFKTPRWEKVPSTKKFHFSDK